MDVKRLRANYNRTTGYCYLCGKNLAFKNYASSGSRGAWEIEHSKPRSQGGTNPLNNLYPACISCNGSKGNKANRKVRSKHDAKRVPLTKTNKKIAKKQNAVSGGVTGTIAGNVIGSVTGLVGIRVGAVIGGLIGAKLDHDKNPDKN